MPTPNTKSLDENGTQAPAVPPALERSAGFLLNRAGRIIRDRITEALAPLRLTPRDLGMLRILHDEGPMSQQALGKRHNIDRTTVVQVLDALEARQLVIRMPNTQDRRAHLIHLTPRGRKTMSQALRITERQQKEFLAPLDDAEWEALRATLIKLLNYHHSSVDQ